ncbi:FAD-binding protein [Rhizobium pusense]|nr:FAD-binding protein [Agrobacterium pusense]
MAATPTASRGNGRAVVVGASLAGLMAALAVARAGLTVTVVERSAETGRTGAALQIGDAVLERLTGMPTVRASRAIASRPGQLFMPTSGRRPNVSPASPSTIGCRLTASVRTPALPGPSRKTAAASPVSCSSARTATEASSAALLLRSGRTPVSPDMSSGSALRAKLISIIPVRGRLDLSTMRQMVTSCSAHPCLRKMGQ